MMNESVGQAFFQIKRNKTGALIVSVNTDALALPIWPKLSGVAGVGYFFDISIRAGVDTYSTLEKVTGKRTIVALGLALGLGVGMSTVIAQQPSTVGALSTPVVEAAALNAVTEIEIKEAGVHTFVGEQADSNQATFGSAATQPGQAQPLLIAGTNSSDVFKNLDQVQLGQEVKVLTKNNSYYRYTVTEIRQLEPKDMSILGLYSSEKLIVYTPPMFGLGKILAVVTSPK